MLAALGEEVVECKTFSIKTHTVYPDEMFQINLR